MELVERACELLANLEYINIATVCPDGSPWNTPVYAQHDSELNFYWSSWKEAEHSRNIQHSSKVFFTLYDSTRVRGDNNRRCLFFAGEASELEDLDEIAKACELLYPKDSPDREPGQFLGDGVRRIYKAIPRQVWLNDKSEKQITLETIKMRIEVPLSELTLALV